MTWEASESTEAELELLEALELIPIVVPREDANPIQQRNERHATPSGWRLTSHRQSTTSLVFFED